jgi:hypothetical protein
MNPLKQTVLQPTWQTGTKFLFLLVALLLGSSQATRVSGNLTLTPKNGALHAELKLERLQNNQLLVWMWSEGRAGWLGRKSQPVEPVFEDGVSVYRFIAPIRQAGMWSMRTMIGAGQAGFIGFSQFYADPNQSSAVFVTLQNNFSETVPSYVQPMGYAVYGVVALFALGLTTLVFRRLEQG